MLMKTTVINPFYAADTGLQWSLLIAFQSLREKLRPTPKSDSERAVVISRRLAELDSEYVESLPAEVAAIVRAAKRLHPALASEEAV